jgi:rhodanese-related sulfurtransferase
VRPSTKLAAEAGVKIGASGAVEVDEFQRTSDPDIYAVGDVAEVVHAVTATRTRIPLAGPANRQGRLAGEHAATGRSAPAGRVLGTAIVKVFDVAVASTGLNERDALRHGIDVDTAYVLPAQHAAFYPGSQPMRVKLNYEKSSSRIVGAQIIGTEGVDKRIDVIATAIHFKGTIDDLASLDLAYAPQFGSAKDAIHQAAFVAQNQRDGLMSAVSPAKVDGEVLVDVRSREEFKRGTLCDSINIPLETLRDRIDDGSLDPGRPTSVFCQIGLRGYIAQRILAQRGFVEVRNVKGGYSLAKLMGVK